MLFCITVNYTPEAIQNLMANPETSRLAAVQKVVEAAGGKVVSLYSTVAEGPGAMVIVDLPDPISAPAISGVVAASGAVKDVRLMRLLSADEVVAVRKKAAQLRDAYKAPGK